jgi:hypothetical protein
MTLNEIWEQVKVLSPEEWDELVRRLLSLPTDTPAAGQMHDILEFEGIAQAYVNRIRRS